MGASSSFFAIYAHGASTHCASCRSRSSGDGREDLEKYSKRCYLRNQPLENQRWILAHFLEGYWKLAGWLAGCWKLAVRRRPEKNLLKILQNLPSPRLGSASPPPPRPGSHERAPLRTPWSSRNVRPCCPPRCLEPACAQAPIAILPLRATPDEKNKSFSRTPSPAARPSVAPHTQEFGGGYPSSPDFDDERRGDNHAGCSLRCSAPRRVQCGVGMTEAASLTRERQANVPHVTLFCAVSPIGRLRSGCGGGCGRASEPFFLDDIFEKENEGLLRNYLIVDFFRRRRSEKKWPVSKHWKMAGWDLSFLGHIGNWLAGPGAPFSNALISYCTWRAACREANLKNDLSP